MAQRVQVLLVCDLHDNESSDTAGTETIAFGLDGSSYEIDVCDQHGAQLRDSFASYVGAARRAGRGSGDSSGRRSRRSSGRASSGSGDRQRVSEVRDWARKNGHQVNERGRISGTVMAAYEAAH